MGGSGGGFGWSHSREEVQRELESTSGKEAFETEINRFLDETLREVNERDINAVATHLEEIRKALESEIAGTLDLKFGGSIDKKTYVNGLSDVDSLVLLNKTELTKASPREVLSYFVERLRARFPSTTIEQGDMAVTVRFNDIDVQLVPAIKSGRAFKVSSQDGMKWSAIDPKKFSSQLTKLNSSLGGKLISVIKLAKTAISTFPIQKQLRGYHVEALAVEAFKSYKGPLNRSDMLKHLFVEASKAVNQSLPDVSGQSRSVDEYLGKSKSLERQLISDALDGVVRKLRAAELTRRPSHWIRVFSGD